MSQTPNAVCEVCGTPYYRCKPCIEAKGLHWKKVCCTTECFKVYMSKQTEIQIN
jgi:hypothetical protein